MFNKAQLLRITKVSEGSFNKCLGNHLVPRPDQVLWLNPVSKGDCFPDYVLSDLFHFNYLAKYGICSPWELNESILGGEGKVMYEDELQKRCGNRFYSEVHLDQSKVSRRLCHVAEESFRPQGVASLTFRTEKVGERTFLVLSRVLLRPKEGFFEVRFRSTHSKDSSRRIAQAYRMILERSLP